MNKSGSLLALKFAVVAVAVTAFGAPAFARDWRHDRDDRGRHEYHDGYRDHDRDRDYRDIRLRGPGVDNLNPWFRNAKAGRRFAAERAGTHISNHDARMLNREFRYRDGDGGDRRWR